MQRLLQSAGQRAGSLSAAAGLRREKVRRSQSGISKGYLIVAITNSKQNEIKLQNGKIASQKPNSLIHGMGISIVQEIAAKYDGSFDIEFTDDTFTAHLALKADG